MQQLTKGMLLHGGTYKIEQVLGQGSFGITYLAIHTALDKKVAIKEFFMKELNGRGEDGSITGMSDGSLSMDYARKFQKEAHNLARLEHPNIVRVTDSFEDNGTFYYVMDYIEGENLNEYVKQNHISQQEAVDIIRDVAKALMYMHEEKHMLHLDLKPGNIMRRKSDGHIFLIDFGLSKHYNTQGQPETSTTIGLGTPGYAPIEQANQTKNGEFRPTLDIYALGATFYKLLTGETPPAASELVSDDEILVENLRKHEISDKLIEIIVNAMLPNVKYRTQRVHDFIATLPTDTIGNSIYLPQEETANSEKTLVIKKKQIKNQTVPLKDGQVDYNNQKEKQKKSDTHLTLLFIIIICGLITPIFIINCGGKMGRSNEAPLATDSDSIQVDSGAVAAADSIGFNGYHEIKYSDGSEYKGYWEYGHYDGQGTYHDPQTGYTFTGNWYQGEPSGYGVQIWEKERRNEYMCRDMRVISKMDIGAERAQPIM